MEYHICKCSIQIHNFGWKAHRLNTLTDEDDEEQAQMVQLNVGVGEGVAEGGVDYHEQNDAAHRPERRLPAVQTLSQEPPAHLHTQNMFSVNF